MNEKNTETQQQAMENQPIVKKKSGLATAGFVLGIVGICTSFIPIVNNASFFLGALAAVFGIVVLIKRMDKAKATIALILGLLSIVITLALQASWSKAIDDAVDEMDSAFNDLENDMDYMAGNKTEDILTNYLSVTMGKFTVIEGEYFDETEMSVTLKNIGSERKSFDITIEAVDTNGNRIATDTVYVSELGAGQSQTFKAFDFISSEDIPALKTATFKISSASMY